MICKNMKDTLYQQITISYQGVLQVSSEAQIQECSNGLIQAHDVLHERLTLQGHTESHLPVRKRNFFRIRYIHQEQISQTISVMNVYLEIILPTFHQNFIH